MGVYILNISEKRGLEYGKGIQVYSVNINRNVITEFEHTFEDGLATCLHKAAEAVERKGNDEKNNGTSNIVSDYYKFYKWLPPVSGGKRGYNKTRNARTTSKNKHNIQEGVPDELDADSGDGGGNG